MFTYFATSSITQPHSILYQESTNTSTPPSFRTAAFNMPLSRSLLAAGEDPNDSESDSESAEDAEPITVPPLLPVPASLAKPNDRLCYTCTALELTPRRFVVLPGDSDADRNEPDDDNIKLGLIKDVEERSNSCPFCRLVVKALSNEDVPDVEDGEAVVVTLSWNTDGPN